MGWIKSAVLAAVIAVSGILGWSYFVASGLRLDWTLSRLTESSNNLRLLTYTSRDNGRRAVWLIRLPENAAKLNMNYPDNELLVGFFASRVFQFPTYRELQLSFRTDDMSVLLANDPLVTDGTNPRKTAGILSVGLEAKSWLVGQPPMWWREEVLKDFGPPVPMVDGASKYEATEDAKERKKLQMPGCKKKPEACADIQHSANLTLWKTPMGSISGLMTCTEMTLKKIQNPFAQSGCSGEFVLPNNRHVWVHTALLSDEQKERLPERVWQGIKNITEYNN